jgi:small-conductance mechanosensitive channel
LLERTPYKATYYLWKVVTPLYRPLPDIILNYSARIPKGEYITIAADETGHAAERIARIIADTNLDYVKSIRGPREFLEHISWMIDNTTDAFRFDYAMTHYMLGNHEKCLAVLEELVSEPMPGMRRHEVYNWAQDIIVKLKTNPSEVDDIVKYLERGNVEKFSLAPSLIKPKIQSAR